MPGKWIDVAGNLYLGTGFNADPATFPVKLDSSTALRSGGSVYDVLTFASGNASLLASNAGRVIRAVRASLRFTTEYRADLVSGGLSPAMVNGSPSGALARMRLPCVFHPMASSQSFAPLVTNGVRAPALWNWSDPNIRDYLGLWTASATHEFEIPDSTVPIGFLGAQAGDRSAGSWGGGLISVSFSRVDGAIAGFGQLQYLVSPRPRWWTRHDARWNWRQGETQVFEVGAEYPDGEKIQGLPIRISTDAGCFDFRPHGTTGPYARSVVVATGPDGVARFEQRAVATGTADFSIGPADARLRDLFFPALEGSWPMTVIEGPGSAGDCIFVPERPAVAAVPGRTEVTPQYGWDAGANSIDTIAGDAVVRFTMDRVIGAIVGFTPDRDNVLARERLTHALYCYLENGQARVRVMEGGQLRTPGVAYAPSDEMRIERTADSVTYYLAGLVLYRSRVASTGVLSVGSLLYATGDAIA